MGPSAHVEMLLMETAEELVNPLQQVSASEIPEAHAELDPVTWKLPAALIIYITQH